jgi:hypothetical protein
MNATMIQLEDGDPSQPPVRRAYVHLDCGRETTAAGDALVLLECPFRPVESTLCERCNEFVKLDRVEWSDSRENIAQYRQRVYDSVSFWKRMYYIIAGNAYEGAINLHLDRSGRPKDHSPSLAS